MPAIILDGLKIRDEIFAELKTQVARLAAQGVRPGLAAVLAGENPASQIYVKSKIAACEQLGMAHWLQTPPPSISPEALLNLLRAPNNHNNLVSNRPGLVACTPAGCMEILRRYKIPVESANAVVLGRSDIVGKPMALLLLHANATVTICHSKTRDLPEVIPRADIFVAAIGKAGYVQAEWIHPGATVIDVGTN